MTRGLSFLARTSVYVSLPQRKRGLLLILLWNSSHGVKELGLLIVSCWNFLEKSSSTCVCDSLVALQDSVVLREAISVSLCLFLLLFTLCLISDFFHVSSFSKLTANEIE